MNRGTQILTWRESSAIRRVIKSCGISNAAKVLQVSELTMLRALAQLPLTKPTASFIRSGIETIGKVF